MKKDHLLAIGIMTGNSLDAADVVLTVFHDSGKFYDLEFFSLPSTEQLFHLLKDLRAAINAADGDMEKVSQNYQYHDGAKTWSFADALEAYMQFVAKAVAGLLDKALANKDIAEKYDLASIDVIGFHGQTCAHKPPSVSKNADSYTVQIGSGQRLANLTGITTIYDFRSDDVMHGGEGAPLAPMHNRHIAHDLEQTGQFPIVFLNGGNTSNIGVISYNSEKKVVVSGWDAAPFNHLPDALVRKETGLACDVDGKIGSSGKVNLELLRKLFNTAAVNQQGENFLLQAPPKSSDPQWYKLIPELLDKSIPFEDRLRTVEYFSAYALFHSFGYINPAYEMPTHFAVFGGGWKNPVVFNHFAELIKGEPSSPVLEEHAEHFAKIRSRLKGDIELKWSCDYGFDGQAMEARIFADMARCRIANIPFTNKEMTSVREPVVCGLIAYPKKDRANATANFRSRIVNEGGQEEHLWSRASKGWNKA